MSDQELSRREKELISIGASVAAGCQPCTKHHVGEARAAGATEPEMRQAVDDALCVRSNAGDVIARHAAVLLGETPASERACCGQKSLLRELTSVSAAFAVNCPLNLADHVAAARRSGATERQIQTAIGLARTIKRVAGSHVEDAADPSLAAAAPSTAADLASPGCGCATEPGDAGDRAPAVASADRPAAGATPAREVDAGDATPSAATPSTANAAAAPAEAAACCG